MVEMDRPSQVLIFRVSHYSCQNLIIYYTYFSE